MEIKDGIHVVAEFEYDGTGRRVLKIYDSQSPGSPDGVDACEHYLHSGQQVIETRQDDLEGGEAPVADSIQPKYQNVWSPRYVDSLILRDENTDSDWLCDDARVFYLADANYNVTALVATNGDVLERYLYTPYGVVTILDADFTDDADGVSDYNNTTLYTGREYDPETGLYYYRARYYHAELGKFIGRDPIVYRAADVNLYRYVGNDATGGVDPYGTRVLGEKGGCAIVFHPHGSDPSGLDLHAAGGKAYVHAHIMQGGKLATRVGENGRPLPGHPKLTRTQAKLVEENKTELRKVIKKARKRLKLYRAQQALARKVPGGKAGVVIGAATVVLTGKKFAHAAFDGAEEEIDAVIANAREFTRNNTFLNCAAYMSAMNKMFVAYGMDEVIMSITTTALIYSTCSQFN